MQMRRRYKILDKAGPRPLAVQKAESLARLIHIQAVQGQSVGSDSLVP